MSKEQMEQVLANKNLFNEALFKRPESLPKYLPYDEYLQDSKIFVLKDGSLGVVFEIELLEHEIMTKKEIVRSVEMIKPFFNLPENCVLQFLYDQAILSPLDGVFDECPQKENNIDSMPDLIFSKRLKLLESNCRKQNSESILNRKFYISVRYFPKDHTKNIFKSIFSTHHTLGNELSGFKKELNNFEHIIKELIANCSLKISQCESHEVIDYLRRFFNPVTYYKRNFAPVNLNHSLSHQFLYHSPILDYPGMNCEGKLTRIVTLKTTPRFAYPGGMAYFTKLNFPFKLSLNFSFPTKSKVKSFFDFKEFFLQDSISAKAKVQKEEVIEVQDRLARGDRCLHMTFTLMIDGVNEEQLEERIRSICHIFHNNLECEVITEKDIGLGLILNTLPLNYSPDSDYSAERFVRVLRSDAQKLIPIFDSFRGMKKDQALYISRENNIAPFSLLTTSGNQHCSIIGGNQRDQGILVNELITSHKRREIDPLVFIIDKGSSHRMLAEFFDADITIFNYDEQMPFTPFRGHYDKQKIFFLTNLICSAVELTSPSFQIESEHKTAIAKSIKNAYLSKCKKSGLTYIDGELLIKDNQFEVLLQMEDIISELGSLSEKESESIREIVEPLLLKLRPFYQDGVYARFFKGQACKTEDQSSFYLYDLDAISNDLTLQTLLTMSVTEEIRRILCLKENRDRESFLILKDFATLGRNNPIFKDYVDHLSQTMGQLGCRLITMSSDPENYFEIPAGRTFFNSSDNIIFLPLNTDQVDYINKKSSLFDEANTEITRSLKSDKFHLEFFYMSKDKSIQGAYNFPFLPLDYWLFPENAKDALYAINLKKSENSIGKCLEKLSQKWPEHFKEL
jgi:hypothetical protein